MSRLLLLALGSALLAGPASAVGLGPLVKEGATDGPDKAFYLTLINPYPMRTRFTAYAVGAEDEVPAARVRILPADVWLAGERTRRIVVIAGGLAPGETYRFRVCAERVSNEEGSIHARVCSRLAARRLAQRF